VTPSVSSHPTLGSVRLVLGGNVFGWTADKRTSLSVLDAFVAGGGQSIDTAECYSMWVPGHTGGESEAIIGEWLYARCRRDDVRIATKLNYGKPGGGLAREPMREALHGSLTRLQTDYIDLYYAHKDDPVTPQLEVAEGFQAAITDGKVRTIGASNFALERITSALDIAREHGLTPYSVLQDEYNLIAREKYEGPRQALCLERGLVMLPYYALASGFLTGKYRSTGDSSLSAARGARAIGFLAGRGGAVLAAMDTVAHETGASLAQIALAWLNAQPGIGAPIASATSVAQVEELLAGARLVLDSQHLALLTAAGA
jgi:aryl-alcohol dehydrogenase-like predicted oxidoreductase